MDTKTATTVRMPSTQSRRPSGRGRHPDRRRRRPGGSAHRLRRWLAGLRVCGYSRLDSALGASSGNPAAADVDWGAFQTWLQERAAAGQFSGTVLVAQDGKPRLEQSYGMADRAAGIANTEETKYCIASIGKLFTAVAVAQLAEAGLGSRLTRRSATT